MGYLRSVVAGLVVIAVLVAAVLISGAASSGSSNLPAPSRAQLRALPEHLAANAAEADQLVESSVGERLAALRGIPVVVNQWASWCPNCREEFPFFQQLSKAFAGRVAFLGLDSEDKDPDAESFLAKYPVPYPSIVDEDASQARSIGAGEGWPTTVFYDRRGNPTYVRSGGYVTAATLRADIEHYALDRGSTVE